MAAKDINWEEAPEGATHCWPDARPTSWRKVIDGQGVYRWTGKQWYKMDPAGYVDTWRQQHEDGTIKRPVEDPFWKDAPEGTTHHFTNDTGTMSWWIKDLGDGNCQSMLKRAQTEWSKIYTDMEWLADPTNGVLKARNPLAVQQKKEEPPKPAQKVGWW